MEKKRTIKREKPKKPNFWKVPKIWDNGECWILGGGPSMPRQFGVPEEVIQQVLNGDKPPSVYSPYLHPIHGRNVIGINAAYLIGNWMKVIFFGDAGFFKSHKKNLAKYPGLVVTCAPPKHEKYHEYGVKLVGRNAMKHGITTNSKEVRWNFNSGASAINLAVHFGATKIKLLGFDMRPDDSTGTHWHSVYKKRSSPATLKRHASVFPSIARDAEELGIEIINVSPNSAIEALPKASLKEIL